MLRSFKTELKPTEQQATKFNQTIGVCRFVYNLYVATNVVNYKATGQFTSAYTFSKWLNNSYLPANPDKIWIKSVSTKAVSKAIMDGETAFKNFFKRLSGFPKFKKKRDQSCKCNFVRNHETDLTVDRHRIKIPTFGFVRLKEKGYVPPGSKPSSVTVSRRVGRYFVSVLVDVEQPIRVNANQGVGVDLGIKTFASCSNGLEVKNVNKGKRVRRLERKLKREQRRLSRKLENKKRRGEKSATYSANVSKQVKIIQKVHYRLANIRLNHVNQTVNALVKTKPTYVTVEDLNVKGLMRNWHLSRAIAQQNFFAFRERLTTKCRWLGIELRVADRWFPSSKTCSGCGLVKRDLKLSDRTFVCPQCGLTVDRDLNAAINLRDTDRYTVA